MAMTDNLEAMLEKGRDDAMLRFGLGSAYFNEGDYERAIEHLQRCLDQDESYSAAYKLLGKSYFLRGELELAEQVLGAGLPVARAAGDKQSEKEITVFLNKIKNGRGE